MDNFDKTKKILLSKSNLFNIIMIKRFSMFNYKQDLLSKFFLRVHAK